MTGAGARLTATGAEFAVYSRDAERLELCLFDETGDTELRRLPMQRGEDDLHRLTVEGLVAGIRYGYRAHGPYDPDQDLWFDPAKLLVDPYALEIDRHFRHDSRLSQFGEDTADLVPKAILTAPGHAVLEPPRLPDGGFIYELPVRGFTMLHPDVPEHLRGTVAALAHPSVIAHLKAIGIDAVELLPITAWIDERHLPPLGLSNSWGYNPIALMALDPRLCPGGAAELRRTVDCLHENGIGVILDLVFNHSGESDRFGATLSMRGLDNRSYYRHLPDQPGVLVNDTGCGNTIACDRPVVRQLILDTLRHFVLAAGVDGFRFDLAPVLGRTATGFEAQGETLTAMLQDPILKDRVVIAEPWDIGPGGYQLGDFPAPFLEWNDRARDTMRRFWRGDDGLTGEMATVLAGSSDIFSRNGSTHTRSVNFIAAHDGFTLHDLVSYAGKHNEANGEDNRDGHSDNHSWNNGTEGETSDPTILAARKRDCTALLSTLFASKSWVMLTAGDEGGRSQRGNNNAYCQDNAITWLDWSALDADLVAHTGRLAALRRRFSALTDPAFFTGHGDVSWIDASGLPMSVEAWQNPQARFLGLLVATPDRTTGRDTRLAILINRGEACGVNLPASTAGGWWEVFSGAAASKLVMEPRHVTFLVEG
ncbi:glycogen debranching protein GlgX [Agrobacterium vitis]|uniref:Glycogen debranching enzyme GlgX n=1 Tax=Agrobacterium vitis TaxID=373 RepID=A0A368NS58_AGRVI|nr:glycogen debranching protein GlgX [Agrobacterium vitis]KAA3517640.1 glycogen debranching enzyme GlgX [Agrobacterium vitis]KAA3523806.1 glycogen debranching enzyme GlgX [Agrobacterium vitis]KAA3524071.1 glycogen debranching enzyme GlgX [Agrobacterium vitis]MCF1476928.1 glycogen debranching protein GlgX [Agrobacterium vitis]MUZ95964.1 glycogen debranching protein GlgX [Agrobacterium vitis]